MKYLLLKIEVVGGDEENPILGHKEIIFTNKKEAEKTYKLPLAKGEVERYLCAILDRRTKD